MLLLLLPLLLPVAVLPPPPVLLGPAPLLLLLLLLSLLLAPLTALALALLAAAAAAASAFAFALASLSASFARASITSEKKMLLYTNTCCLGSSAAFRGAIEPLTMAMAPSVAASTKSDRIFVQLRARCRRSLGVLRGISRALCHSSFQSRRAPRSSIPHAQLASSSARERSKVCRDRTHETAADAAADAEAELPPVLLLLSKASPALKALRGEAPAPAPAAEEEERAAGSLAAAASGTSGRGSKQGGLHTANPLLGAAAIMYVDAGMRTALPATAAVSAEVEVVVSTSPPPTWCEVEVAVAPSFANEAALVMLSMAGASAAANAESKAVSDEDMVCAAEAAAWVSSCAYKGEGIYVCGGGLGEQLRVQRGGEIRMRGRLG